MKKEVLFILLNDFADWESAYIAPALNMGIEENGITNYAVKTVAPTLEPVRSLGGFRVIPDYSFENIPKDYAAIVLIGGLRWDAPEAELVIPIVKDALKKGRIVGAICNGAAFMAKHGFLNDVKHTGNTIEQLKLWGANNYINEAGFCKRQAVGDKNIVTANGTASLEFTRELLLALKVDSDEKIMNFYNYCKNGFYND